MIVYTRGARSEAGLWRLQEGVLQTGHFFTAEALNSARNFDTPQQRPDFATCPGPNRRPTLKASDAQDSEVVKKALVVCMSTMSSPVVVIRLDKLTCCLGSDPVVLEPVDVAKRGPHPSTLTCLLK